MPVRYAAGVFPVEPLYPYFENTISDNEKSKLEKLMNFP